jgi:hypothetical protein
MTDKIDFKKIRTTPLAEKKHKVRIEEFAAPPEAGASFRAFFDSLPRILAGSDMHRVVEAVAAAAKRKRAVILAMGAHVIKCGLSPLVIQMMEKKILTCVAMNGAGIIHDFEVASAGSTSEDVAETLKEGDFGMAGETGDFLNRAVQDGSGRGEGIGAAVGRAIEGAGLAHTGCSILGAGHRLGIPVTVHVGIGTDTIHFHPAVSGAALGEGSLRDFKTFAAALKDLEDGGVYINLGSAVLLPEVFLKAVTLLRNLGNRLRHFTTVNMDFIQHYRPLENVVSRPNLKGGRGIALTGHHEIMLPLLVAAVMEALDT